MNEIFHFNASHTVYQPPELFNDLFGYPVNESTISSAGEICYERLEEVKE